VRTPNPLNPTFDDPASHADYVYTICEPRKYFDTLRYNPSTDSLCATSLTFESRGGEGGNAYSPTPGDYHDLMEFVIVPELDANGL